MTRWTQAELDDYTARRRAAIKRYAGHTMAELADTFQPDSGPESRLQGKIEKWAREWGHPIQSNAQSQHAKTMVTVGWPDITLILPKGRTIYIELKSKSGRLSKEQVAMKLQFMSHGHIIHEIRSYRAFINLITDGESK